jgi:hypothetical protein
MYISDLWICIYDLTQLVIFLYNPIAFLLLSYLHIADNRQPVGDKYIIG